MIVRRCVSGEEERVIHTAALRTRELAGIFGVSDQVCMSLLSFVCV